MRKVQNAFLSHLLPSPSLLQRMKSLSSNIIQSFNSSNIIIIIIIIIIITIIREHIFVI